ncbi:MAG: hypothetical protein KC505_09300, partial [Myxococcales bacterium]|nr:hypothetical protein [Myxococcales bacterium]
MDISLAILCALSLEAEPIIDALDMRESFDVFDARLGLRIFLSEDSKTALVLFGKCPKYKVDRIGTQFATLAAWETIKVINPKALASVGTAGGFKSKGAHIGDVFLSCGPIYYHGRHIPVEAYHEFEKG